MRTIFILLCATIILTFAGCGDTIGQFDPEIVDLLAGAWSGVLDYSASNGAATPMSLVFTPQSSTDLNARLTTGDTYVEDEFVANVNDKIVMNFPQAGKEWELVLEGTLTDSTLAGDIIQREEGKDDIKLGTWSATPST
jgi:hypothetical protein